MQNVDQQKFGQNSAPPEEGTDIHQEPEELWSAPQFSLLTLIGIVTVFAGVFSLIKSFNLDWYEGLFGATILGFSVWFVIGVWRMVRLSSQNRRNPEESDDNADDCEANDPAEPPANAIQPDTQSKAVSIDRRRFQFSIRSLLLFTLIVALAVTSLLMYRRMTEAEKELVKLRNEVGYLKVEDETLFQAIAIPCEDPLTWKWRAYLPKGSKYSWHLNSGMIPATGVLGGGASSQETVPRARGMETVMTVSLRKDPEPKNQRWLFNMSYRSADGKEKHRTGTSIPDQIMDQILQANFTNGECLGDLKAETRKRGETIILVKRRIGEKTSANSWIISSKPQPGFAVWLEEVK
jgi:hypothetical protein